MRDRILNAARVSSVVLVGCTARDAAAQFIVVGDGQVLSEDELIAGFFDDEDQAFMLGPGALFQIGSGGVIGPAGNPSIPGPFDFHGSTVNIFSGGRFDGFSSVSNLTLNLFNDSEIGRDFVTHAGSVVNLSGGSIDIGFESHSSEINISDGLINQLIESTDSTITMTGGVIGNARIGDGTVLNMSGGTIAVRFDAHGSELNISGGAIASTTIRDETTVHLTGGRIGDDLQIFGSENELNIGGGVLGDDFTAYLNSSEINLTGGGIGRRFTTFSGVETNFSGGYIGPRVSIKSGSDLTITGGEFERNGVAVSDLSTDLDDGEIFTGTLADGSVFIFTDATDFLADGTTTLQNVPLDPADTTPMVVSEGQGPTTGLRAGQSLTLRGDATVRDYFAAVGATLNIEGGSVGESLETAFSDVTVSGGAVGSGFDAHAGSDVRITGGTIGPKFTAFDGSAVHISGGEIGDSFRAVDGSVVTISGGSIGDSSVALSGSEVNISGGALGASFRASDGAEVNISGGTFGRRVDFDSGSGVTIIGGEFMLNGAEPSDLDGGLGEGDIFTGTLADGSVFIFAANADDRIRPGSTTLQSAPLDPVATTPIVVSAGAGPSGGLRPGQTLNLRGDGTLRRDFAAVDATLNIEGGSVGEALETAFSEINITGGSIGSYFAAYSGSVVNISGGSVGDGFLARNGSVVNFSGGTFGSRFMAYSGSELNIFGTEFFIGGVEITGLTPNTALEITDRGLQLTGTLVDGSSFEFDLNEGFPFGEDFFRPGSTITVTLVPAPGMGAALLIACPLVARRRRGVVTTIGV